MTRKLLLVAAVALVGCTEPRSAPAVSVTDSAGVTLVVNSAQRLAAATEWRLDSVPSLVISSSDDGPTLFEIRRLTRTESGLLAVANQGTKELLVFDRSGRLVARRGGEGDGPGEFRRMGSVLALGGDSLGVYDMAHRRLSVFGPQGELVREFAVESSGDSDYEQLFARSDGGFAVFAHGGLKGGTSGTFRSMAESFSIDGSGTRTGSFGSFPGAEVFIVDRMAGGVLFGAATFGAVVGSDMVVGTAESPELRFYGDDGSLHRIVRWPDHERRLTEARIDEYMAAAEGSLPEEARSQARAVLSEMPRSDRLPAFDDVLASPDGELWVGAYRGPGMALPGARSPSREWLVFDHEGQLEAKVTTPEGFQPLYVGSGEVIGVYVDDLGVESIRAYEVLE